LRLFAFDRLDRYTLRLFLAPLVGVLVVLLIAQSLERLLRLFDLAASAGAPLASVAVMFANLIPHYLGLSLPMAFTAAIFMAAARLGDDSELDVMLSAGRSLARIAAPFFMVAVLLIPFDLILFGELQPLTRYGYRAAVDMAMQTGWDAKVEENRFINAGHGTIFGAATVEPDGKHLRGVFVERREPGKVEVTTAASGEFVRAADGRGLLLRLQNGQRLLEGKNDSVAFERFEQGRIDRDLLPEPKPFRDRGDSAREQTLPELWVAMKAARKAAHASARAASAAKDSAGAGKPAPAKVAPGAAPPAKPLNAKTTSGKGAVDSSGIDPRLAAEFHGRLAHVFILPVLPLLALPLGMASKRGRRAPGIIFGILALLLLHHLLQFGQSLAENGRLPAAVAVWTPYAVFTLFSLWIFRSSLAWPGDNPVLRAVMAIERSFEGIRARVRRAPVQPAAAAT